MGLGGTSAPVPAEAMVGGKDGVGGVWWLGFDSLWRLGVAVAPAAAAPGAHRLRLLVGLAWHV